MYSYLNIAIYIPYSCSVRAYLKTHEDTCAAYLRTYDTHALKAAVRRWLPSVHNHLVALVYLALVTLVFGGALAPPTHTHAQPVGAHAHKRAVTN